MLNQQAPQLFHRFEQILTGLLDQRLSENRTQRTNITAQRIIFRGLVGKSDQFGQAGVLVVGFPQRLGMVWGHLKDVGRINDARGACDEKSG